MIRRGPGGDRGFSLAELVVAAGLASVALSAVVAMIAQANVALELQPERADVEQRVRVATEALQRDLLAAGGGASFGPLAGPMGLVAATVIPARVGRRLSDPPGLVAADRITLVSIDPWAPQAILSAPLAAGSGTTTIEMGAWCPAGDASCGFRRGMQVVVYDMHGAWSMYSITGLVGSTLQVSHQLEDWAWVFAAGTSVVAEATIRTYQTTVDRDGVPQLVRYDGGSGVDVPVAAHVTRLSFAYFGDAAPPSSATPFDLSGARPRTTYGPPPPAPAATPTTYPAGENCAFVRTAGGAVAPRLASLGDGPSLVRLTAAQLSDGPWCPDERSPNRFDADLLRVRLVTLTVRVEASSAALRGAGPLFSRPGSATATRFVPDRESVLAVAPRALNLRR